MDTIDTQPSVPRLTVMVDYGNAPFLWIAKQPEKSGLGSNLCDGTFWDESYPLSEGLWRKFADWAIEFDRTAFYRASFDASDWDWAAYHDRGLQLSRWLKEEVGNSFRVVYQKPCEDPNHMINERTEILTGGGLVSLTQHRDSGPGQAKFCQHIVSGGQTGADRAALDFAITHGYTHGGWAPYERKAEDGTIPVKYQLREMDEGGYRQRTRRNVEDSDGTLILNLGKLDGGSLATQKFAKQSGKPYLVLQLDAGMSDPTTRILEWLRQHSITALNVAGPRESKRPGIYGRTIELLEAVDAAARSTASRCAELEGRH